MGRPDFEAQDAGVDGIHEAPGSFPVEELPDLGQESSKTS
jgi:hypothetical protein